LWPVYGTHNAARNVFVDSARATVSNFYHAVQHRARRFRAKIGQISEFARKRSIPHRP
jgi:hypothetical protein